MKSLSVSAPNDVPVISVAMATYNGAIFLAEQLTSLAEQSLLPSELVVIDDGSTDDTPVILDDFAKSAPFPVHFRQHMKRQGPTSAFADAIEQCRGDIIFLCDQDDYWHCDKINRLTEQLMNTEAVAVICDADLVDESLNFLGRTLWQSMGFSAREQRIVKGGSAFAVFLRKSPAYGMTMAFRSELRDLVLPIPTTWGHDGWILWLASATSQIRLVEEPLVLYRQHASQEVPFRATRSRANRIDRRVRFLKLSEDMDLLIARLGEYRTSRDDSIQLAQRQKTHYERRGRLPKNVVLRIPAVISEIALGRYWRFGNGIRDIARDLTMP
jgi:glycosyltransferase involved in cell wall biosynthesis